MAMFGNGARNALAPQGAAPTSLAPQNAFARASEDDVWMAQMRERQGRNAPYAKPGPYTTQLPPDQEAAFRQWVAANRVPFNPNDRVADYDMRGFWLAQQQGNALARTAIDPNDGQMHFTDQYKTPYHQTFSAESQYAYPRAAPHWVRDRYLVNEDGKTLYDDVRANRRR